MTTGEIARHLYECMRREAACLRIQKEARMLLARKKYIKLYLSAIHIQTGMRGMAARILVQHLKQTQAAIFIQVSQTAFEPSIPCDILYLLNNK